MKAIDTHVHILQETDDGPKTIEGSVEIAKKASQMGIKKVLATPHVIKGTYKYSMHDICERVSKLNKELKTREIDIEVIPGAENYIDLDIDTSFAVNKRYIIIELPFHSYPDFCTDVINKLLEKRLTPIIAHPEKNYDILKDILIVEGLINKGCLMQLTADSIFGNNTNSQVKSFALHLLENNGYHLISSNAHSAKGYKYYNKLIKALPKYLTYEQIDKILYENPNKVLDGEKIEVDRIRFREKKHSNFGLRAMAKSFLRI